MQKIVKYMSIALISASISLSGCGKVKESCVSKDADAAALTMLKESAEKSAISQANGKITASAIRSSIDQLKMSISKIRTTKTDPNSTKKYCTGTVRIVFPIEMIKNAEYVRKESSFSNIQKLADDMGAQLGADVISFDLEYNIQASDDKKTMFAESESSDPKANLIAEIVLSAGLKTIVETAKSLEKQQQDQSAAADLQLKQANNSSAVAENKLSEEALSAAWNAIDASTKTQISSAQTAWMAAKKAGCLGVAGRASTDPLEQNTARMNCEIQENNNRISYLGQY